MPISTQERVRPPFSILLEKEMERQNISINDLAIACGPGYEHFRQMVNGPKFPIPSKPLLRVMSQVLGWDYDEVSKIANQDRMEMKFGKEGFAARGVDPEAAPFHLSWDFLTDEQKQTLLTQLQEFLAYNRHTGAVTPVDGKIVAAKSKPRKS